MTAGSSNSHAVGVIEPPRGAGEAGGGGRDGRHRLPPSVAARVPRWLRSTGLREVALLLVLYTGYSASRLLAGDDVAQARSHARALLWLEDLVGLDIEHALNDLVASHEVVGVAASYHYATAHYLVTAAVLAWLYVRRRSVYLAGRQALVVATLVGLGCYLLLPVAPPRLAASGYVDVLREHSSAGWWGGDASAPRGLGGLTNELAAMPSLHAGWALWVALVVAAAGAGAVWRLLASAHVLVTALVVVGTGNHWVLDVGVGWLVVLAAAGHAQLLRPPAGTSSRDDVLAGP